MSIEVTQEVILDVRRLTKRFGGVVAASSLDFSVRRGELRCVVGPNGAGKSTFFSLLCGILIADGGEIAFAGRDVTRLAAFRRVRLGMGLTFQTNRTFHALSVRDNLDTARGHGSTGASEGAPLERALDAFGLHAELNTPARELPHHQQQWLEICMALAGGPRLLLLDEPTAGMSPGETRETAGLLRTLAKSGLAIVVVEHDMGFVRDVADSVTVLHQGAIFAEGSIEEISSREDVQEIYLGRPKGGKK